MDYTDRPEELEEYLKINLKESRFRHSLGVQRMASHLAAIHGADVDKASFAGRYHDIAKCFKTDRMNELIKKYSLPDYLTDNPALAHSKVGAMILKNEFNVCDTDILNSVSSHTTGRDGMSLLEEIVYVSDAIEENRSYEEAPALRKQAETDLDGACLFIMDYTIDKVTREGRDPGSDTLKSREFIYRRIKERTTDDN
ncbi:MAG: bis(5'-nucleosyl)-tetraphosphatase (symmetrical) YqeK [Anaerovoracaceae bacterium]